MNDIFVKENALYLSIKKWEDKFPHLIAGCTTNAVNMDLQNRTEKKKVLNDRKRMSEKLGIPLANWIGGRQSHGTNIEIVGKDDSGKGSVSLQNALKSTDGIITKDK